MNNLYARCVFFVRDADESRAFYTERLGFSLDWDFREDGRTEVCQVSLFGFELILNRVHDRTSDRAGHGRAFVGLDDGQREPLREHLSSRSITARRVDWGRPTLVLEDPDRNELFFWLPGDDLSGFELASS